MPPLCDLRIVIDMNDLYLLTLSLELYKAVTHTLFNCLFLNKIKLKHSNCVKCLKFVCI